MRHENSRFAPRTPCKARLCATFDLIRGGLCPLELPLRKRTSDPIERLFRQPEKNRPPAVLFSLSINPLYGVSGSFTQGELEGAKPASNKIKCRAKPCLARRAWSKATIFVPQGGTKITTLFQAVEKSRRLFRQPGEGRRRASLLPYSAITGFHR